MVLYTRLNSNVNIMTVAVTATYNTITVLCGAAFIDECT